MQAKYYLVNFDPVAVSLGPLDIHWYGVMYLLAFLAFWWLGNLRAERHAWRGWSRQDVADMLFYGMLGVIVGGGAALAEDGRSQGLSEVAVPALRGSIVDRNGAEMAMSLP